MHSDWAIERVVEVSEPKGWTDRRERRTICRTLARVPSGSAVLDIPCGPAHCLEALVQRGYRVTCAHPSETTLASASRRWERNSHDDRASGPNPTFVLAQPRQTNFPDRHFDAVVCTGLFDRLDTSNLRIETLRELRRISRGPVVVSFCNAFALGALPLGFSRKRASITSPQSIPVPVWTFLNDIRRAGLNPIARHAVLWGISPLWHIVSVPVTGRAGGWLAAPQTGLAKAA
jgi:SAM-dependent methyltransferase